MIIYLVGDSCVGKSTIGKLLANKIGFDFYDLDREIEKYYKKPIERIQQESIFINEYRRKASVVLDLLFSKEDNIVIAGNPSGLKFHYLRVYKKYKTNKNIISLYIKDSPENILKRLTFYDKDSKPITVVMDDDKKEYYLREIKSDHSYFKSSYERADYQIDIENVKLNDIPNLILRKLQEKGVY